MKKHFLFPVLFFLLPFSELYAQLDRQNEIGIITFSIRKTGHYKFLEKGPSGLIYKRHFDNTALRLKANYWEDHMSFEGSASLKSDLQAFYFSGGIQKRFAEKRWQPFVGADLVFEKWSFVSESSGGCGLYYFYGDYDYTAFGASLIAGMDFFISTRFSLSFETGLDGLQVYKKGTEVPSASDKWEGISRPVSTSNFRFYWNPVSLLSLNFHF
ncbi:MAG: hypothetical protein GY705_24585 [Bacteroidetes bacterium]|nr:hypothetical protein [Bacteroidota bacterium]